MTFSISRALLIASLACAMNGPVAHASGDAGATDKTADTTAGKSASGSSADKAAGSKTTNKAADKATAGKASGKASDKGADKAAEKAADKAADKKPAENAAPADAQKAAGPILVPPPTAAGLPVALIGSRPITLAELDSQAGGSLLKIRQQEYDVRAKALDAMINDQLFAREATSKGVSATDLLKAEVLDKITDPTASEIDAIYQENKERIGDTSREEIDPKIKAYLREMKFNEAQQVYVKSLRQKYAVKVLLEPPRIEVSADNDASKGPANAPITIIEFSDYQCPFCSKAQTSVDEVVKKYGDKVRLVFRDFPLEFHANAQAAAQASECAREQGKFWEMHTAMFADQSKLGSKDLLETAVKVGANKKKFQACMDSGKFKDEVKKDQEDGVKVGVTGTPCFFINGVMLEGAQEPAAFSAIIDQELERQQ